MKTWALTAAWPILQPILVPLIAGIVVEIVKKLTGVASDISKNEKLGPYLPILGGLVGAVFTSVTSDPSVQNALTGAGLGLGATGVHQVYKQRQAQLPLSKTLK